MTYSSDVLIYLASPYSALPPEDHANVVADVMHALSILAHRLVVYSPIVHWHAVAKRHILPTSADWWARHNEVMLRNCVALYVFEQPGWESSRGIAMERAFMRALKRPETLVSWHDEARDILALRSEGGKPALYATKTGITSSPY